MIKNIGLGAATIGGALILVIFGSAFLHYLDRETVLAGIGNPPYKGAYRPEVFKDTTAIPSVMASMATDTAAHPKAVGQPGARAVFQRNPWYQPDSGRSWETALKDVRKSAFALSSKENFILAVSRGVPGVDHPGVSGLTGAQWDSLYNWAKTATP